MSSEVLERQLEDQHEVRMLYISPLDPDCKRVIERAARHVAERYNKEGWSRGEKLPRFRGESRTKTVEVNVHPLDPPNSGAGKGRPAYFVDKLGGIFSRYNQRTPLRAVNLESMDLMERKRLEILLGLNLSSR